MLPSYGFPFSPLPTSLARKPTERVDAPPCATIPCDLAPQALSAAKRYAGSEPFRNLPYCAGAECRTSETPYATVGRAFACLPTFVRQLPLDCAARMTGSMAVQSGPPATSGCETRQARKGATVAAKACAGMRLDRIAARPGLAREGWSARERNPGEVSEWSKEHAWKVCMRQRIEGSNPSLSAKIGAQPIVF